MTKDYHKIPEVTLQNQINKNPSTDEIYSAFLVDEPEPQPQQAQPKLLTMADAFEYRPPIVWIVEGLIQAGSVNVLYGDSATKKTFVLLDLCMCVSHGAPWLGMATTQSNVFIVDEESGKRRILDRMQWTARGRGYDQTTPVYCHSLEGYDLDKPQWYGQLITMLQETSAGLCIIDAMMDVMPGKKENEADEMNPLFRTLRKIAEDLNVAFIVVHHANKQGGKNDFRGSTAIKGAVDVMIKVESEPGADLIKFTSPKTRDQKNSSFSANANFMLDVEPKMFWLTEAATPKQFKAYPKGEEYVLCYLRDHGASSVNDIKANAQPICAPGTASNAIGTLFKRQLVARANDGGQGVEAIYKLTEEGAQEAENL